MEAPLGQLKQQCESLKSSMETLKSQISSTVESSEDEIQAKINTFSEEKKNWESMTLEEHMQVYESQGIARKEAMKLVAKDRGISKRDVYQALLS